MGIRRQVKLGSNAQTSKGMPLGIDVRPVDIEATGKPFTISKLNRHHNGGREEWPETAAPETL